jgi:hypothetical protein
MPISTSLFRSLVAVGALMGAALSWPATAAPKTVCTITVNSPDEKDTFRRHLPPGDYQFVELVERGRPDWLASACQQRISCDALIISGHFDGGTEFYTDRFDVSESLTVEEMERAACSDSCPGVFSQLKEVYLFGCNTLMPEPRQTVSDEIVRSLVRSGRSPADAAQLSSLLGERHAESNRDRMRSIFKDVPVLYGFSSKAPLGRYAGPLLERYFQAAPAGEIGSGKVSTNLLELFAPSSMTVTTGLGNSEPQSRLRGDVCHFLDERIGPEKKITFMHQVLQRDMTEVRMLLGHLEQFAGSISLVERIAPRTAAAFATIASDDAARRRYLEFARDADETAVRTRMMALATKLGWLTPAQEQTEFISMIAQSMERGTLGREEVDLACSRGQASDGDSSLKALTASALKSGKVASAAAMACLGSAEAHARVTRTVTGGASSDDVAIAQAYLRHRPLTDTGELRALTSAIGRMSSPAAQVSALETLAQQRLADAESLREIARLFPLTRSVDVQRAIAHILIRADHASLVQPDLARTLRQHRIRSADGEDVIDALIRLLPAS